MEGREGDEYQKLVTDLSARLRRACSHLSDAEFSTLVHDIARVSLRIREIDQDSALLRPIALYDVPPPPITDA
jgi:hypothetical protein